MNEPSWTSTPTQSFELPVDFHTLPNTDFTKETTKNYPESISVNVDLPSPRIEKRRVQNRASQKAFRQRQADYMRTLELELEELRTKYDNLCLQVGRIKQAVEEMCMEGLKP